MSNSVEEVFNKDLNHQLTSLPDILCAICKKVLCAPIVLVANIGNVCRLCRPKIDSDPFIPNTALENILKHLVFPCEYHHFGCQEKVNYWNMQVHQRKCKFFQYKCPMSSFTGCDWSGPSFFLLHHLEQRHEQSIKYPENRNLFKGVVDVTTSSNTAALLFLNNEKFLMQVKCDVVSNSLRYAVYYLGDSEDASSFQCNVAVKHRDSCNSCIQIESSFKALPNSEIEKAFDPQTACSFDLDLLRQLAPDAKSFEGILQISKPGLLLENVDDSALSIFECPVCNNYMKPPIFQCMAGHSICNKCRPRLSICPSCRASFGSTRNFSFENLCNGYRFPCAQRELGCYTVLPAAQLAVHEQFCTLRYFDCPFVSLGMCKWDGRKLDITNHLKTAHSDRIEFTNSKTVTTTISHSSRQNSSYLFCYGELFRLQHKIDIPEKRVNWCVERFEVTETSGDYYKYEVALVHNVNKWQTLTVSDLCGKNNPVCSIPLKFINKYVTANEFSFTWKVTKIT